MPPMHTNPKRMGPASAADFSDAGLVMEELGTAGGVYAEWQGHYQSDANPSASERPLPRDANNEHDLPRDANMIYSNI